MLNIESFFPIINSIKEWEETLINLSKPYVELVNDELKLI